MMRPKKLWKLACTKKSRLILALDYPGKFGYGKLLERLKDSVAAVKIGYPVLFSIGVDGLSELISSYKEEYYFIADYKIADIPAINGFIAQRLKEIGFDGAIAHAIVGRDSLRAVSEQLDLFALVAMSHPGSAVINSRIEDLIEMAIDSRAVGIVAPATFPKVLAKARRLASDLVILSPGVGAQGAEYGSALLSGADFEIVGRGLTLSENPVETAKCIVERYRTLIHESPLT